MADKMMGVFVAAGTNCAKLAKGLNTFIDENAATQKQIEAYEKAHPAVKKKMRAKMKAKEEDMNAKMGPSMDACGEDKAVAAALKRLE